MPSRRLPEVGALSHSDRRLLQGLYTSGPTAYGSIVSLVKSSGLSRGKVLEFLHGRKSYTKYHLATRKFPRLKAIAKYINEIWCMDLAYVDKLASENRNVKYLLVSVDVLSRFVRVQPLKDKYANTTKQAFIKMMSIDKPKKVWVDQGTEFEGAFKKYCQDVDVHIYHTFSETKAAYAERAIRSLKNIIYRFLEEADSFKYIHKLESFVKTMNSRVNRSIKMAPKDVTNKDAIAIINSNLRKVSKPRFNVGDYVRIAKKDIPFRKGYKPQFTDEIFKITVTNTRNPPTYTLQDKDFIVIKGKFYESEMIKYTN